MLLLFPLLFLFSFVASSPPPPELFSSLVSRKLLTTASLVSSPHIPTNYPAQTTRDTGAWQLAPADTWTTGFLPSTFYALHTRAALCPARFGNESAQWLALGRQWATGEDPLTVLNHQGHDVGFLSYPFVDELTINPTNVTARATVNTFASMLAARFNPIVGCTRSWDAADPEDFQVIIDNMMNLEVLFVSADLTGNTTLRDIAISHADKTMTNHVRADGSSFHVVDYNATTGVVFERRTAQGYADWSTWSRGQAWGVYGFANMYRRTGYQRYLDTSRRMAQYFINHIPAGGIVPWDFLAPLEPPRPADSSAAMIVVNGLLLLAQQEAALKPANDSGAGVWRQAATKILDDTTSAFWKPEWASLLSNGTVNNHGTTGNNDTGIVYGDYYFIQAANTLVQMGLATC
ncbi:glycoside hydrolase family 88 protein [Heterobasidion irregulare TC 32-1]|uniref:Glycoside hydrolase family 88 protein n=1 Tax=Heterobasidion irregulare (strain TC 32-1) TaxID=747525 RepID=W4JNW9_HETIT|nr:glycoside hydrolase family 88 protein [Heterobasidion irregulare TC 32-1]ETW75184.1 glycoside hydrolase family 88 protein [Heterobasidion irregulare TC 32-1]